MPLSPTRYLCESENGKGNPGPELFVRLALEYNVNPNYLFIGNGKMFSDAPIKIKKQEFDINDDIDIPEKLFRLLDKSVFFRGRVLSQVTKLLFEEKDMIKHSLRKELSQ